MSKIKPFRGLRPAAKDAKKVASPPYDVLNSKEARKMAEDNPISFLHVTKPEIDLDPSVDIYTDEVYAKAKENFDEMVEKGVLVQDETPCLYLYEQTMRIRDKDHVQIGVMAGAGCEEYKKDLIKKHELTRTDKEVDRTRNIEVLNANSGMVFLTYKANPTIDALVAKESKAKPIYDFTADDGIKHRLWVISNNAVIKSLTDAFAKLPCIYVADGHHRSASATIVYDKQKAANPKHTGEEGYCYFLSVIFPHNQMYIMDYNRVVLTLGKLSEADFMSKVCEKFEITKTDSPKPTKATEFGMYIGKTWYRLKAKKGTYDAGDPVKSLDVSILQDNLLAPLLGIENPRTDKRIDFVGGIRGMKELERRVNEGGAVAFAMCATSIDQLMAIADAGRIMPPKSTWFEPKLRDGLVVRMLD